MMGSFIWIYQSALKLLHFEHMEYFLLRATKVYTQAYHLLLSWQESTLPGDRTCLKCSDVDEQIEKYT